MSGLHLKKPIAAALSIVYFSTQIAFSHQTESNIWQERRHKLPEFQQFAALPTMENAVPALPRINLAASPHLKKISANLLPLAETISLSNATIQESDDEDNYHAPPVVIIQDIHMNSEAQTNIAMVLQSLINAKQVGAVGVEGAFGAFDFSPFRTFSDKEQVRSITAAFVAKNMLAAHSFVGITSAEEPPPFFGIDDREHYNANVTAYLESQKIKTSVLANLQLKSSKIRDEKQKKISPSLKHFDDVRSAYASGSIGLGKYVDELAKLEDIAPLSTLQRFQEAYRLEKSINFTTVDSERKSILEILSKKLTAKETKELLSQSVAVRQGRISLGSYFGQFKDLLDQKGVELYKTPAFQSYLQYVVLADGIQGEKLFDEIGQTEEKVAQNLIRTEVERKLCSESEHLALTKKLVDLSLTPKEWEKYKKGESENSLKAFEEFYVQADIRSRKMVEKVGNTNRNQGTALVVGGFHTLRIAQLLREKKIPCLIVSPKITKVDDASGSGYLTVFAREKTPIEKLFTGTKLFLADKRLNITEPSTSANLLSILMARLLKTPEVAIKIGKNIFDFHVQTLDPDDPTKDIVTPTFKQSLLSRIGKIAYLVAAVNWENAVFLIVPLANMALPGLGILGWAASAALFAVTHPRSLKEGRFFKLFGVGMLIGLPFLFGSSDPFLYSSLIHGGYNAIVVALRATPRTERIGKWLPFASVFSQSGPTEYEKLKRQLQSTDKTERAKTVEYIRKNASRFAQAAKTANNQTVGDILDLFENVLITESEMEVGTLSGNNSHAFAQLIEDPNMPLFVRLAAANRILKIREETRKDILFEPQYDAAITIAIDLIRKGKPTFDQFRQAMRLLNKSPRQKIRLIEINDLKMLAIRLDEFDLELAQSIFFHINIKANERTSSLGTNKYSETLRSILADPKANTEMRGFAADNLMKRFENKELGGDLDLDFLLKTVAGNSMNFRRAAFFAKRAIEATEPTSILGSLKQLKGEDQKLGYLVLTANQKNKSVLELFIDDSEVDIRLRIFAYGLFAENFDGLRLGSDLRFAASKFLSDFSAGGAGSVKALLSSPLGLYELRVLNLAILIQIQRGQSQILEKNFPFSSFMLDQIKRLMESKLARGYDNANSKHEYGTAILRMLDADSFLLVVAHELMHNITSYGMNYRSETSIHARSIHEILSDIFALWFAETLHISSQSFINRFGFLTEYLSIKYGSRSKNAVVTYDGKTNEAHQAARAVLWKVLEYKRDNPVAWQDLFDMAATTLMVDRDMSVRAGKVGENFDSFVHRWIELVNQKNPKRPPMQPLRVLVEETAGSIQSASVATQIKTREISSQSDENTSRPTSEEEISEIIDQLKHEDAFKQIELLQGKSKPLGLDGEIDRDPDELAVLAGVLEKLEPSNPEKHFGPMMPALSKQRPVFVLKGKEKDNLMVAAMVKIGVMKPVIWYVEAGSETYYAAIKSGLQRIGADIEIKTYRSENTAYDLTRGSFILWGDRIKTLEELFPIRERENLNNISLLMRKLLIAA